MPKALVVLFWVLVALTQSQRALAVGVTVEVTDAAEVLLDSRLARRLITLELADVELPTLARQVPAREKTPGGGLRSTEVVFVRLLAEADVLTVELWAQGLLTGERRIRVVGTEEHQARRVALACAELARHVREARLLERQRVLREHLFPSERDGPPSHSIAVTLGAAVNMRAVWLPTVESALIGPSAAVWVRSQHGFGLGLDAAYYHAVDSTGIRFWWELGLRPSWMLVANGSFDLELGARAAMALVDVGHRVLVRGASESQQTWTARVGLEPRFAYRLAPKASLTFGLEAALLLRDIHLEPRIGGTSHLRGLWLGFGLGAEWFL